jgi:hypothetical protein
MTRGKEKETMGQGKEGRGSFEVFLSIYFYLRRVVKKEAGRRRGKVVGRRRSWRGRRGMTEGRPWRGLTDK